MTNKHEAEFKSLHAAALTLSTQMIAKLRPAQTAWLENAVRHGGKIIMELGALPDCQRVDLTLVEHEGQRTVIATIGAISS
jgi:hypothetical protein